MKVIENHKSDTLAELVKENLNRKILFLRQMHKLGRHCQALGDAYNSKNGANTTRTTLHGYILLQETLSALCWISFMR